MESDYIRWIRDKVGRRKIFLVFATVILSDDDGRVLLQQRRDFARWGLPGGALEWNEDIIQCARRELAEETGLTAGPLALVGVYSEPEFDVIYPNGDEVQQFTICFSGRVNGGRPRPDQTETCGQAFFSPSAAAALDMLPWYRTMLQDFNRGDVPMFRPPMRNGRTIDQIRNAREVIGNAPLIAVGALALIQREDGRILLVQRQDNGAWTLPAGFSDIGENVAQTAVREIFEETGYHVQPQRIIAIHSGPAFHYTYPNGDQVKNVGVLFKARLLGGEPQLQEAEVRRMAWLSIPELQTRVPPFYAPFLLRALQHLHDGYFLC